MLEESCIYSTTAQNIDIFQRLSIFLPQEYYAGSLIVQSSYFNNQSN